VCAFPFIVRTSGCFVAIVTNLLGNLRIWLDTGVMERRTAAECSIGVPSVHGRTFRRCQDLSQHKCLPTVNDGIN